MDRQDLLKALNVPDDREFLLLAEEDMQHFIEKFQGDASSSSKVLRFPRLPSYHRLLLHTLAKRFQLRSTSEPMWDHNGLKWVYCFLKPACAPPLLGLSDFILGWPAGGKLQSEEGGSREEDTAHHENVKNSTSGRTGRTGAPHPRALYRNPDPETSEKEEKTKKLLEDGQVHGQGHEEDSQLAPDGKSPLHKKGRGAFRYRREPSQQRESTRGSIQPANMSALMKREQRGQGGGPDVRSNKNNSSASALAHKKPGVAIRERELWRVSKLSGGPSFGGAAVGEHQVDSPGTYLQPEGERTAEGSRAHSLGCSRSHQSAGEGKGEGKGEPGAQAGFISSTPDDEVAEGSLASSARAPHPGRRTGKGRGTFTGDLLQSRMHPAADAMDVDADVKPPPEAVRGGEAAEKEEEDEEEEETPEEGLPEVEDGLVVVPLLNSYRRFQREVAGEKKNRSSQGPRSAARHACQPEASVAHICEVSAEGPDQAAQCAAQLPGVRRVGPVSPQLCVAIFESPQAALGAVQASSEAAAAADALQGYTLKFFEEAGEATLAACGWPAARPRLTSGPAVQRLIGRALTSSRTEIARLKG
eukprot:jgi/Mesen1/4273/ME000022S03566